MKKLFFVLLVGLFNSFVFGQKKDKIIVVIDPGHGGSDPGHTSQHKHIAAEKTLNLIIAQRFGELIEENLQNIKIVYTRTDDSYPTLTERVRMANTVAADYFISIHCNANDNCAVHGTETHVHTMKHTNSLELAKEFEKEFSAKAGRHSRGVKDTYDREHSLQVLKYTKMTGVLIECGFLTNDSDAAYLNSVSGQEQIAGAIFKAFQTSITKQHPSIAFTKPITSPLSASATNKIVSGTYAIQIMSSKAPVNTNIKDFEKIGLPVSCAKVEGGSSFKYRYMAGIYSSKDQAKADLEKVQKNGFKDAFVVKLD